MSDHVLDLQRRWTNRLAALLDRVLEDDALADLPLTDAVAATWRQLAADQPEVRATLDTADPSPELAEARAREHWTLALAAGLARPSDPREQAARIGRTYLAALRSRPAGEVARTA
jgi:hypothetical protein